MNYFLKLSSLIILFPLLILSCSDDDDAGSTPDLPSAAYFFQANIDGESVTWEQAKDNFYAGLGSGGGGDIDSYHAQQFSTITQVSFSGGEFESAPFVSVEFNETFVSSPDLEELVAIYQLGDYSYSVQDNNENAGDGVAIIYSPDGDKVWSTYNGSQTGSTFELTEFIDNTNPAESPKIISAEFKCTLYDDEGNSIELSSGNYRGLALSIF